MDETYTPVTVDTSNLFKQFGRLPLQPYWQSWDSTTKLEHLQRVLVYYRDRGAHLRMHNWFSDSEVNECGTAACAAGYAATDPTFIAAGLRVVSFPALTSWTVVYDSNNCDAPIDSLADFFGITKRAAMTLFLPDYYAARPITFDHVIAKLDTVLAVFRGDF